MGSSAASTTTVKHSTQTVLQAILPRQDDFALTILIKKCSTTYTKHVLRCPTDATGENLFDNLRYLHRQQTGPGRRCFQCLSEFMLMRRIAVGTARIFEPYDTDLEDQQQLQILHIEDTNRDELLTQAFRKPALLRGNTTFSRLLQRHNALTIGYVFDRPTAWLWTFVAVIISIAAGIIYSVVAKDLNTGLAIGTVILAVLLAFQGLLVFLGR